MRANDRPGGVPCAVPGAPAPVSHEQLKTQADALFGDMPDGVLIQHDGRIVYANRSMVSMLRLDDASELIGTVALELYPDSAFASVLSRVQSVYFGRPSPVCRHPLRRADGSIAEFEVSSLLLRLAGALMLIEVHRSPEERRRPTRPLDRGGPRASRSSRAG